MLKYQKYVYKFWATFSTVSGVLMLATKWIGLQFGRFFINSSGHPAPEGLVQCMEYGDTFSAHVSHPM
jgi:hypothetical protein